MYSLKVWEAVLLPGESHGRRSLLGCSPRSHQESDTTERLHFHFSLSCIGEGNGNPLQCSCLENPRDRGAWWDAVYGVAQGRTRLKWFSRSLNRGVSHAKLSPKPLWEILPRFLQEFLDIPCLCMACDSTTPISALIFPRHLSCVSS